MPPKSSAGKEKDLGGDEEVLQAVILADSFNQRFRPLTVSKPRVSVKLCLASHALKQSTDRTVPPAGM